MANMKELYDKVAADKTLQAEFEEIMGSAEKDSESVTVEKLISFAKGSGYDMTIDEMKAFFVNLSGKTEGVLTDDELDMVAGGKGYFGTALSVISFGVGCAVMSATKEIGGDSCKDYLNGNLFD